MFLKYKTNDICLQYSHSLSTPYTLLACCRACLEYFFVTFAYICFYILTFSFWGQLALYKLLWEFQFTCVSGWLVCNCKPGWTLHGWNVPTQCLLLYPSSCRPCPHPMSLGELSTILGSNFSERLVDCSQRGRLSLELVIHPCKVSIHPISVEKRLSASTGGWSIRISYMGATGEEWRGCIVWYYQQLLLGSSILREGCWGCKD